MKKTGIFGILVILVSLNSCAPSAPYEIKSPCVSNDQNNSFIITPCPKKPINQFTKTLS